MKSKNIKTLIENDIIPVIIYNKINYECKLQRKNNNTKIINTKIMMENKDIKNKFYIYLNDFTSTLINLKHCDFKNFNNNILNLNIIEKYSKIKGFLNYGTYFAEDNKIELYNKNFEKIIYHELLHMASTKKINNKLILTGFCIIDFKSYKKYGVFLNEGYTEYLNLKYFNNAEVYKTQVGFIKQLEKIIGEELMQQMYFNADLKGLINELIKYKNTKEEVLEFIINTDLIHKYRYSLTPIKRLKLKKVCIKVNAFLVKSYYVKLLLNNLTYKDRVKELTKYMNSLVDIDIDFKSNYYYMEEINNYYNKILKKKF